MIGRFHELAIAVPFGADVGPDNHNPTDVIAHIYASGLGLPDRDYYLKTGAALRGGAREVPRARREDLQARRLRARPRRRPRPTTVVRASRSSLAEASLDNVALRDPKATDHKTTFADLQKLDARASTGRPTSTPAGIRRAATSTSASRSSCRGRRTASSQATPLADWKTYLQVAPARVGGAVALDALRRGELRVQRARTWRGAKEMKPRWKRCVGVDRRAARRGARARSTSRSTSRPRPRRACRSWSRTCCSPWATRSAGLDWMSAGDQGEGAREARDLQPEDRLSRQVEGLQQRSRSAATRTGTNVVAGRAVQRRRRPARRSASRSTAAAGA